MDTKISQNTKLHSFDFLVFECPYFPKLLLVFLCYVRDIIPQSTFRLKLFSPARSFHTILSLHSRSKVLLSVIYFLTTSDSEQRFIKGFIQARLFLVSGNANIISHQTIDWVLQGTVIGITQLPPREGARSALLHICLRQTQTDY